MIRAIVCGVAGRMGQRLAHLILESDEMQLVGATEHSAHQAIGQPLGDIIGSSTSAPQVTSVLSDIIDGADVILDFTTPEATLESAAVCSGAGTAMVVGTTGFSEGQLEAFHRTAAPVACVFAPNYSTAMNVLFRLVEEAARILGDEYDVEVVEAHHRLKVDAPSGTALRLAERAAAGLRRTLSEVAVHGRQGIVGARPQQEIGIHAIRMGDVAGDHAVLYGGAGEYLELRHHATSRDAFVRGALRAACFAAEAEPGRYDMGDVLGIK